MKYLLIFLLFIGSLLFSPKSFSEETDTQRNFKPCQIMMDQFDAYAKIDPLKGESSFRFTDWHDDPGREGRLQHSFIYRAMKPGIGKAYFYPAYVGLEKLDAFFEQNNMKLPTTPSYIVGELYDDRFLNFYDLSKSSGYVIIAGVSNDNGHWCISNQTLRVDPAADGFLLSNSEPSFYDTGPDCDPDFTAVNIEGIDYILNSDGADWLDEDGSYRLYIELYPLGSKTTNLSECSFRVNLEVTAEGIGTYKGTNPAPRTIWKY